MLCFSEQVIEIKMQEVWGSSEVHDLSHELLSYSVPLHAGSSHIVIQDSMAVDREVEDQVVVERTKGNLKEVGQMSLNHLPGKLVG